MPVYVHVIDHPDARVLVDTGMTQSCTPAMADLDPRLRLPASRTSISPASTSSSYTCTPTTARQLPRGQADLRPASGARRRAQQGRLHHPRVGRGARRAVRAGRRRARAASGLDCPGAGPHRRHAGGRRRDRRASGSSSAATWRCGSASSTSRPPKAGCGYLRSTPSWSGSRTSIELCDSCTA